MKSVAIIGTRGVPAAYGGYETFAQELLSLHRGHYALSVYCDRPTSSAADSFNGCSLHYLPITKAENQLKYYWLSIQAAAPRNDVVLITGPGAGFFVPIARLRYRNTKFLVNPDGLEFRRSKWSLPVRLILFLMSWVSVLFSNRTIADSRGIAHYYCSRRPQLKKKINVIEYGSRLYAHQDSFSGSYFLLVTRLVPENNVEMIVLGFLASQTEKELLIVSDLPDNAFQTKIQSLIDKNETVHLLGPIYDQKKLENLRCKAYAHLHGHSVGGTNPSLLEAMSATAPVIAHQNRFNQEVLGDDGKYFSHAGDLAQRIDEIDQISHPEYTSISLGNRKRIDEKYNWGRIYEEYSKVFHQ